MLAQTNHYLCRAKEQTAQCHLCILHSPHQLATSIQIQMKTLRGTIVRDSLRAISSGLLLCLAKRLFALWFHHAEALTPFRPQRGGRERGC